MCNAPTAELQARKPIRIGIEELSCACASCHHTFTTLNPFGLVAWAAMLVVLNIGFAVAFALGKVKEGDGPGLVVALLVLDALIAGVGWRAWRNHRRNPPLG